MINFTWSKTHGLVGEDEKRLQKRISVLYSSSLKNFCEKLEIILVIFWKLSILCRLDLTIFYLLQIIPLILLKMWKTHKYCSMFLFQSRDNKFWSIDASCAAYRDEDVAGRWAKILLALRGDMFWNSSLTRREIKKIASSVGHTEFISVCVYHLEKLDRIAIKWEKVKKVNRKMMFTAGAHAKKRNAGSGSARKSADRKSPQIHVSAEGYTYRWATR